MSASDRHVRLFRNGRKQALRMPRACELPGDEAILRKEADRLVSEAMRRRRLLALLGKLDPIEEPFADVDPALAHTDEVELCG
jgi:antitoxin VapB